MCSFYHFAARVEILHQFSPQKNFVGPHRSPEKSEKAQNLSKALSDSGIFWLTLTDFGRL